MVAADGYVRRNSECILGSWLGWQHEVVQANVVKAGSV